MDLLVLVSLVVWLLGFGFLAGCQAASGVFGETSRPVVIHILLLLILDVLWPVVLVVVLLDALFMWMGGKR